MKPLESIYNSILLENQNPNNIDLKLLKKCVVGTYNINDNGSVDVKGDIYYSSKTIPEDKDKIRRDRDVKTVLKDSELGDLDV